MKHTLLAIFLIGATSGAAAAASRCEEQLADISARLTAAKSSQNKHTQKGLEATLDHVKTYCSDEEQENRAAQALRRSQQNANRANQALSFAEEELSDAELDRNEPEIRHKKDLVDEKAVKVERANTELKKAQDDFEKLRNE